MQTFYKSTHAAIKTHYNLNENNLSISSMRTHGRSYLHMCTLDKCIRTRTHSHTPKEWSVVSSTLYKCKNIISHLQINEQPKTKNQTRSHTHSRNVQRNDNKMSTTTTPTEYMFVKNKTMHIIISFTFLSKRTLIHSRQYTHSLTHVYMPMILIVFKWRISLWLHGNCYYEYNCCCCSLHSACHFHFCVRVRSKCTFVLLVSYLGSV